jgi:transcriptional regulator with XRE-family HTH domain
LDHQNDEQMNKAADVVKRRRLALALTQPELARKSRLRLSQVADLENGRGKLSRILLRRLAHALDLDWRLLMPLAHTKAKLPDLPGVPLVLSGDSAQMWRRFLKDQILRSRYHITRREIQALKNISLLGYVLTQCEFLTVLTLIREPNTNRIEAPDNAASDFECATGGHGRCVNEACGCRCHSAT